MRLCVTSCICALMLSFVIVGNFHICNATVPTRKRTFFLNEIADFQDIVEPKEEVIEASTFKPAHYKRYLQPRDHYGYTNVHNAKRAQFIGSNRINTERKLNIKLRPNIIQPRQRRTRPLWRRPHRKILAKRSLSTVRSSTDMTHLTGTTRNSKQNVAVTKIANFINNSKHPANQLRNANKPSLTTQHPILHTKQPTIFRTTPSATIKLSKYSPSTITTLPHQPLTVTASTDGIRRIQKSFDALLSTNPSTDFSTTHKISDMSRQEIDALLAADGFYFKHGIVKNRGVVKKESNNKCPTKTILDHASPHSSSANATSKALAEGTSTTTKSNMEHSGTNCSQSHSDSNITDSATKSKKTHAFQVDTQTQQSIMKNTTISQNTTECPCLELNNVDNDFHLKYKKHDGVASRSAIHPDFPIVVRSAGKKHRNVTSNTTETTTATSSNGKTTAIAKSTTSANNSSTTTEQNEVPMFDFPIKPGQTVKLPICNGKECQKLYSGYTVFNDTLGDYDTDIPVSLGPGGYNIIENDDDATSEPPNLSQMGSACPFKMSTTSSSTTQAPEKNHSSDTCTSVDDDYDMNTCDTAASASKKEKNKKGKSKRQLVQPINSNLMNPSFVTPSPVPSFTPAFTPPSSAIFQPTGMFSTTLTPSIISVNPTERPYRKTSEVITSAIENLRIVDQKLAEVVDPLHSAQDILDTLSSPNGCGPRPVTGQTFAVESASTRNSASSYVADNTILSDLNNAEKYALQRLALKLMANQPTKCKRSAFSRTSRSYIGGASDDFIENDNIEFRNRITRDLVLANQLEDIVGHLKQRARKRRNISNDFAEPFRRKASYEYASQEDPDLQMNQRRSGGHNNAHPVKNKKNKEKKRGKTKTIWQKLFGGARSKNSDSNRFLEHGPQNSQCEAILQLDNLRGKHRGKGARDLIDDLIRKSHNKTKEDEDDYDYEDTPADEVWTLNWNAYKSKTAESTTEMHKMYQPQDWKAPVQTTQTTESTFSGVNFPWKLYSEEKTTPSNLTTVKSTPRYYLKFGELGTGVKSNRPSSTFRTLEPSRLPESTSTTKFNTPKKLLETTTEEYSSKYELSDLNFADKFASTELHTVNFGIDWTTTDRNKDLHRGQYHESSTRRYESFLLPSEINIQTETESPEPSDTTVKERLRTFYDRASSETPILEQSSTELYKMSTHEYKEPHKTTLKFGSTEKSPSSITVSSTYTPSKYSSHADTTSSAKLLSTSANKGSTKMTHAYLENINEQKKTSKRPETSFEVSTKSELTTKIIPSGMSGSTETRITQTKLYSPILGKGTSSSEFHENINQNREYLENKFGEVSPTPIHPTKQYPGPHIFEEVEEKSTAKLLFSTKSQPIPPFLSTVGLTLTPREYNLNDANTSPMTFNIEESENKATQASVAPTDEYGEVYTIQLVTDKTINVRTHSSTILNLDEDDQSNNAIDGFRLGENDQEHSTDIDEDDNIENTVAPIEIESDEEVLPPVTSMNSTEMNQTSILSIETTTELKINTNQNTTSPVVSHITSSYLPTTSDHVVSTASFQQSELNNDKNADYLHVSAQPQTESLQTNGYTTTKKSGLLQRIFGKKTTAKPSSAENETKEETELSKSTSEELYQSSTVLNDGHNQFETSEVTSSIPIPSTEHASTTNSKATFATSRNTQIPNEIFNGIDELMIPQQNSEPLTTTSSISSTVAASPVHEIIFLANESTPLFVHGKSTSPESTMTSIHPTTEGSTKHKGNGMFSTERSHSKTTKDRKFKIKPTEIVKTTQFIPHGELVTSPDEEEESGEEIENTESNTDQFPHEIVKTIPGKEEEDETILQSNLPTTPSSSDSEVASKSNGADHVFQIVITTPEIAYTSSSSTTSIEETERSTTLTNIATTHSKLPEMTSSIQPLTLVWESFNENVTSADIVQSDEIISENRPTIISSSTSEEIPPSEEESQIPEGETTEIAFEFTINESINDYKSTLPPYLQTTRKNKLFLLKSSTEFINGETVTSHDEDEEGPYAFSTDSVDISPVHSTDFTSTSSTNQMTVTSHYGEDVVSRSSIAPKDVQVSSAVSDSSTTSTPTLHTPKTSSVITSKDSSELQGKFTTSEHLTRTEEHVASTERARTTQISTQTTSKIAIEHSSASSIAETQSSETSKSKSTASQFVFGTRPAHELTEDTNTTTPVTVDESSKLTVLLSTSQPLPNQTVPILIPIDKFMEGLSIEKETTTLSREVLGQGDTFGKDTDKIVEQLIHPSGSQKTQEPVTVSSGDNLSVVVTTHTPSTPSSSSSEEYDHYSGGQQSSSISTVKSSIYKGTEVIGPHEELETILFPGNEETSMSPLLTYEPTMPGMEENEITFADTVTEEENFPVDFKPAAHWPAPTGDYEDVEALTSTSLTWEQEPTPISTLPVELSEHSEFVSTSTDGSITTESVSSLETSTNQYDTQMASTLSNSVGETSIVTGTVTKVEGQIFSEKHEFTLSSLIFPKVSEAFEYETTSSKTSSGLEHQMSTLLTEITSSTWEGEGSTFSPATIPQREHEPKATSMDESSESPITSTSPSPIEELETTELSSEENVSIAPSTEGPERETTLATIGSTGHKDIETTISSFTAGSTVEEKYSTSSLSPSSELPTSELPIQTSTFSTTSHEFESAKTSSLPSSIAEINITKLSSGPHGSTSTSMVGLQDHEHETKLGTVGSTGHEGHTSSTFPHTKTSSMSPSQTFEVPEQTSILPTVQEELETQTYHSIYPSFIPEHKTSKVSVKPEHHTTLFTMGTGTSVEVFDTFSLSGSLGSTYKPAEHVSTYTVLASAPELELSTLSDKVANTEKEHKDVESTLLPATTKSDALHEHNGSQEHKKLPSSTTSHAPTVSLSSSSEQHEGSIFSLVFHPTTSSLKSSTKQHQVTTVSTTHQSGAPTSKTSSSKLEKSTSSRGTKMTTSIGYENLTTQNEDLECIPFCNSSTTDHPLTFQFPITTSKIPNGPIIEVVISSPGNVSTTHSAALSQEITLETSTKSMELHEHTTLLPYSTISLTQEHTPLSTSTIQFKSKEFEELHLPKLDEFSIDEEKLKQKPTTAKNALESLEETATAFYNSTSSPHISSKSTEIISSSTLASQTTNKVAEVHSEHTEPKSEQLTSEIPSYITTSAHIPTEPSIVSESKGITPISTQPSSTMAMSTTTESPEKLGSTQKEIVLVYASTSSTINETSTRHNPKLKEIFLKVLHPHGGHHTTTEINVATTSHVKKLQKLLDKVKLLGKHGNTTLSHEHISTTESLTSLSSEITRTSTTLSTSKTTTTMVPSKSSSSTISTTTPIVENVTTTLQTTSEKSSSAIQSEISDNTTLTLSDITSEYENATPSYSYLNSLELVGNHRNFTDESSIVETTTLTTAGTQMDSENWLESSTMLYGNQKGKQKSPECHSIYGDQIKHVHHFTNIHKPFYVNFGKKTIKPNCCEVTIPKPISNSNSASPQHGEKSTSSNNIYQRSFESLTRRTKAYPTNIPTSVKEVKEVRTISSNAAHRGSMHDHALNIFDVLNIPEKHVTDLQRQPHEEEEMIGLPSDIIARVVSFTDAPIRIHQQSTTTSTPRIRCEIDAIVKDLQNYANKSYLNSVLGKKYCEIVVLHNPTSPKVQRRQEGKLRVKRSYFEVFLAPNTVLSESKREIVLSTDLQNELINHIQIEETDSHKFVTPGSRIVLSCAEVINYTPPENYVTWFLDGYLVTTSKSSVDANGQLTIENAEPSDQGNYTCLVRGRKKAEQRFVKEVVAVALPTFDVNATILYEMNQSCTRTDEAVLRVYFMGVLGHMLCGKEHHICHVEILNCTCLTTMGVSNLLFVDLTFHLEPLEKIVPDLNINQCQFMCQLKTYTKLITVLVNNIIVFETQPMIYNQSIEVTLTPSNITMQKSGLKTETPKLVMACPPGFGIGEHHVCMACERNHYNKGTSAYCLECPPSYYQPALGSKECLSCSNPFENRICMMYYLKRFQNHILIAMAVLLVIVIGIVCIALLMRRARRKRNQQPATKNKKKRNRDIEMQENEPLLDNQSTQTQRPFGYRRTTRFMKSRAPQIPILKDKTNSMIQTDRRSTEAPPTPPPLDIE